MTQLKTASKFTPGPYEVVKLHDGGVGVAKKGYGTTIATFHDYVESDQSQEAKANARFYKAAPEMYELLLFGQVAIMEGGHNLSPLMHKWLDDANRIKAAIDGEG